MIPIAPRAQELIALGIVAVVAARVVWVAFGRPAREAVARALLRRGRVAWAMRVQFPGAASARRCRH